MAECVSLFSGGGLADVGLKAAGYTPVLAVEWDAAIAECYADNHGPHVQVAAVEDVDYRPWAGVDFGWASPCCTNASQAKTDGKEEEADLSAARAVCRFIQEARPRVFVLENVPAYRNFESFRLICGALLAGRYAIDFRIINSADHGVPQTRRRLILRGMQGVRFVPRLTATHVASVPCGGLFGDLGSLLPWVGWHEAIEDLLGGLEDSDFAPWQLERLGKSQDILAPLKAFLVGDQGGPGFDNETCSISEPARPSRTVRALGNGGSPPRAFLMDRGAKHGAMDCYEGRRPAAPVTANTSKWSPRALLVHPTDQRSMPTAAADEPAFTVTTGGAGGAHGSAGFKPRAWLDAGRVVKLDARCLARFQSVPDSYRLPAKAKLAYRIVGNGVPCLLAQRIAESLR